MVPAEGFEPPTTRLRSGCSTAELRRLKRATDIGVNLAWQAIQPLFAVLDYRNHWRSRCHASVEELEVSSTGSRSRPWSSPGSSGACTKGMTGSTGGILAATLDFTFLRRVSTGFATGGAIGAGSGVGATTSM